MSMQPEEPGDVPAETVRVARAAFPKGSLAIRLRDELGVLFTDEQFAGLFPARGKPAVSPGRLALVSVLQFAEGLPDRQAALAVRARIDWKYALGLELTDAGFDYSVLCEFRARLVEAEAGQMVFDRVLDAARQAGVLKPPGRARTDSTHVLAAIRSLNRLEFVIETLRAALNAVAAAAPEWLTGHADPAWFDRYAARPEDYWLPSGRGRRTELAEQTGRDGMRLLTNVHAAHAPCWLRELPAVQILRRAWVQQYAVDMEGEVRWRDPKECPPGALRLVSPYDTEARASVKRDIKWDGFKVHLTETCDPDTVHLITNVLTSDATVPDIKATDTVHDSLADKDLLPGEHLLDAGYLDGPRIVTAQTRHDVTLTGPIAGNTTAQAAGPYGQDAFTVDWDNKTVTCPNGMTTSQWRDALSHRGTPVIRIQFSPKDCRSCPSRPQCINSTTRPHREITLRPRAEHEAIRQARAAEGTPEWRERYAARNGIEGTISHAVRVTGLRQCRYHGLAKTRLQHQLTATAINLARMDAWSTNRPRARTRTSHLTALRPAEHKLNGAN
ncbi:IS1182 family transposase [Streptomyces peucetius]|uniref:IS1182 family transposase n=1 Tax=Streptomyces peucetius TaxID=1950 RepID=A0ABY6I4B2_STRPE|nr:IS1182 family transposase [Streptomyces peucetius]UYQ61828.1 IS1182 family transposase [Streptomyces peucetius]UYQ61849.1 IS1182 family transposase [Streptomyces peucetius]UYQ61961.1 IS1182 family transposase [Streptomyces peucetius]UYQ62798.1 IS1182 family transposase [Streptomyces peucetius]UYQ62861.1 IS1182 family transposase [Streptomyces peucetius]